MSKTNSVAIQMQELLEEFNEDLQENVEKSAKLTARSCVKKLKSTSPKRTGEYGEYAESWSSKNVNGSWIVFNKLYQLTHLLENGHVVRNKYGTFGRAPAIKHIAPVEAEGIEEFQVRISKGLK